MRKSAFLLLALVAPFIMGATANVPGDSTTNLSTFRFHVNDPNEPAVGECMFVRSHRLEGFIDCGETAEAVATSIGFSCSTSLKVVSLCVGWAPTSIVGDSETVTMSVFAGTTTHGTETDQNVTAVMTEGAAAWDINCSTNTVPVDTGLSMGVLEVRITEETATGGIWTGDAVVIAECAQ